MDGGCKNPRWNSVREKQGCQNEEGKICFGIVSQTAFCWSLELPFSFALWDFQCIFTAKYWELVLWPWWVGGNLKAMWQWLSSSSCYSGLPPGAFFSAMYVQLILCNSQEKMNWNSSGCVNYYLCLQLGDNQRAQQKQNKKPFALKCFADVAKTETFSAIMEWCLLCMRNQTVIGHWAIFSTADNVHFLTIQG